jgi:hypothetical protein
VEKRAKNMEFRSNNYCLKPEGKSHADNKESSSSYGSTAQFGPWTPLLGFLNNINFLRGWIVSPAPNPQPGGPGLRIYDPQRQDGPAISPGTGYTFLVAFYDMHGLQWDYF